jgi:hypothetical protein
MLSHGSRQFPSWLIFDVRRKTMSDAVPISVSPLRWTAVVTAPFAVVSIYLWLSRWPTRWFTATSDYTAFAIAMIVFGAAVMVLPLERRKKMLIAVCGAPFLAAALTFFAFVFVGAAFGDWL